jgi:hypothetical protein
MGLILKVQKINNYAFSTGLLSDVGSSSKGAITKTNFSSGSSSISIQSRILIILFFNV